MMHVVIDGAAAASDPAELVSAAARCWRLARDEGAATQPRLHALLSERQCPMLAVAFDSLLHLYEQALDHPFAIGDTDSPSEDEVLLTNLLRSTGRVPPCVAARQGAASAFDCALCSMRILLTLAPKDIQ
ncbi:hypothetical protein FHR22_001821 [Sphingopyxis panaciterrae]|uniref:hypothetical protein n=1 Tax=Sphingopyxis panaciterrae TaxID=363841 RepID=UPI001420EFB6|nr:hypothetical protein [Sphingopyxis panaciterrae]NIJ37137.1 hypothetical protein [Sphingopyxis panaciterrae]